MEKLERSKKYKTVEMTLKGFLFTLIAILTFIVLSISVFNIIYIQTSVVGFSMQPTLNSGVSSSEVAGDIVLVNRFMQGNIGDIVVAEVPWRGNSNVIVIKRLIAKENDRVKFVRNSATGIIELYVNGYLYNEPYVTYSQEKEFSQWNNFLAENETYKHFEIDNEGYLIIPEKHIYILGDNRSDSYDCSEKGPVPRDCIIGRVDSIIPYGDNVKQSISRFIFNIFRLG